MKGVLNWIKKNLIIVVSVLLILVFIPVGFVFSSGWNETIKKDAAQAFTSTRSELQRAGSVQYALPRVLEGETTISETRAPNRAVTRFFEEQRATRVAQVADVVDRGTAFNQRRHDELVPGLLPRAVGNTVLRRLGMEMAERIAGTADNAGNVIRSSVYTELLRRLNAGTPPDPVDLGAALAEFANNEQQRYASGSNDGRLSETQAQELARRMVDRRLQEYSGRAKSLTFYASIDAIRTPTGQTEPGWSTVPATPPPQSEITEADAFVWLWDYWVIGDVLEAVTVANTDPQTGVLTVPDAPIKRVERVRVAALPIATASNEPTDPFAGGGRRGGGARASSGNDPDGAAIPAETHTRRASNADYDIRMVQLTIIASSRGLPSLFDALGRVNNMTVVDVDITPVDVWADLAEGFFYGEEHVVRATIDIETVWLRSWTLPLMPDRVREAVGAPTAAQGSGDDGGFGSDDRDEPEDDEP